MFIYISIFTPRFVDAAAVMCFMCQIDLCCVTSVRTSGVLACPMTVLRITMTSDWTNDDGTINTTLVLLLSKVLGNNFCPLVITGLNFYSLNLTSVTCWPMS